MWRQHLLFCKILAWQTQVPVPALRQIKRGSVTSFSDTIWPLANRWGPALSSIHCPCDGADLETRPLRGLTSPSGRKARLRRAPWQRAPHRQRTLCCLAQSLNTNLYDSSESGGDQGWQVQVSLQLEPHEFLLGSFSNPHGPLFSGRSKAACAGSG